MQSKEKPAPFDDENGCLKLSQDEKIWKFVHEDDYQYQTKILEGRSCDFNWLKIAPDGTITVKGTFDRGYAWDGCTPKFNFLHITWGNFDGKLIKHDKDELNSRHYYTPLTYFASMVHDVLYQYKRCGPYTRKEADKIFYIMLKTSGFMWARVYYTAVVLFGWVYSGWKYKSSSGTS